MKILIEIINKDRAVMFIQKYHYSNIMPRLTKYYLGIFSGKELLGVITLGWGTQPLHTIQKIFYKNDLKTKDYLEIGKMCFLPEMNNTNSFGSQVISLLVKWLKENTKTQFLYTLADGIMGKCGYVYQASNFIYIGSFQTQVYIDNQTQEKIHPRSAKKLLAENGKYSNKEKVHWLTFDFCEYKDIDKIIGLMFRYIMPLNKKARKLLQEYDEYLHLPYPKDKDLIFKKRTEIGKYVEIPQPQFNMSIMENTTQKKIKHYQMNLFELERIDKC